MRSGWVCFDKDLSDCFLGSAAQDCGGGGESNPGALWVSAMESSAPGGCFVWTSFAARIGAGSVLSQCLAICASEIVGDRLPFL